MVVEVRDLAKRVDNGGEPLTILHEISFAVAAAETVAIVGASGSGKSTLLGLLAGLDLPSSGSVASPVRISAVSTRMPGPSCAAACSASSFQSFQLLPSLTALENVMLPLELAGTPNARAGAEYWLQRVGLAQRLRHYPKHLSGGEQQRVALARAFAPGPRLVLADEPTGNLDAATGHQVIELMFAINAERGTTLILVTHDEEIAARCARRMRMHAGQLEEISPGFPGRRRRRCGPPPRASPGSRRRHSPRPARVRPARLRPGRGRFGRQEKVARRSRIT
jgi:putative ABC transport system ATP-binding protein